MAHDDDIEYDRSLLGVEHPIGSFPVTREMILGFLKATADPALRHQGTASNADDLVAPPTFCNVFIDGVRRPDIKLTFGEVGLFASQAIENLAPIRPGDTLEARTKLQDVYAKTGRSGPMVFVVWETRFVNQDGVTVARVRDSFMRRNRKAR